MKLVFKNITKYTKEETRRFALFHQQNNKLFAAYIVMSILLFIMLLVVNIANKNWELLCWLLVAAVIAYIYYKFFKKEKEKARRERLMDKTYEFEFYDRLLKIHNQSTKEDTFVNYFEIKRVFETDDNFYIYMGITRAYLINKNGFTVGTIDDFRSFIKQKCIMRYRKRYETGRKN